VAMKTSLLAVVLLAMSVAPSLAHHDKTHKTQVRHLGPGLTSEHLRDALGGFNRGDPNDPYWDPCLSYDRDWGPGACE